MSKFLRVLGALAALTMAASTAHALDIKNFFYRCTPGAVRACASLQVTTQALVGGGTAVVIKVRNEEGNPLAGLGDNTGGSIIRRLGIIVPTIVNASGLTVGTQYAGVNAVNNPDQYWVLREPGGLGGLIELTVGVALNNYGGVIGCNSPTPSIPSYYQTCNTQGWVTFSFTTQNTWSADEAEVAWLTMYNAQDGLECGSNNPAAPRLDCPSDVVPEPITMVLLGTGLAGVGGAGFVRRRREENGDVTDA